ncbi:MAG: glycosyltransferase family 2 protein [Bacteroidia bacterium]
MKPHIQQLFEESRHPKGNLISIILPVYNEALNLERVVAELYEYLPAHQPDYRFEITFIDDCSKDNSFNLLTELSKKSPSNVRLSVVKLAKNSGSHIAITAGLNIIRGAFCIIMASDGQDPCELIGQLLEQWKAGNDIVLAARFNNLDKNFWGKFFSRMAWKIMIWSTRINIPKKGCDMLGLDKKAVTAFNNMDERNTTFIFRILSLGFKQTEIQYVKRERFAGKSSWTFWKKISIMLDAITGYSSRPLQLITKLGMLLFLVLIARWAYIVVSVYIFKNTPTELTIILNTIFTALAVQMLLLGMIGDYIWRILEESRKRPLYEIGQIEGQLFND